MRFSWLTALLLLLASTALAGEGPRILIPINLSNGVWGSFVVLQNNSDTDLQQAGVSFITTACPIPEGCISDRIPAHQFAVLVTQTLHGLILRTPVDDGGRVDVSVRVAAAPRIPTSGGTEIPVPRDSDFRTRIVMPSVVASPAQRPVRAMLRIYSLDAPDGTVVKLQYTSFAPEPPAIFPDTLITLSRPADGNAPAYAEVDLFRALQGRGAFGSLRIEGANGPVPLWALLTYTDNVTNEVTAITPN